MVWEAGVDVELDVAVILLVCMLALLDLVKKVS